MRLGDFGVMWQIYRLCVQADQVAGVADILPGFRPSNFNDARHWLSISLESYIICERLKPAIVTANELLRVDPSNSEARNFLARVK